MNNAGIGTPYWFEWEIGIIECLKMLQDSSIESVVLQSADFYSLDDVVVNYYDKTILSIQVKHTDINENFTYSFLASGKKPMLNELAKEWKTNKDKYSFKGIHIATNRRWGIYESEKKCSMKDFVTKVFPKLQSNYSYISNKDSENKAITWYKATLEKSLNQEEAEEFTKYLSFRMESNLAETEEKIRSQIETILGVNNEKAIEFCLNNLLSKLKEWATSRRKKQEITKEDVYATLCYSEPAVPGYELYPEKPILPSRIRFAEKFINTVTFNDNHIIFLEGLPGVGKTNFVSYLSQMKESIVDFKFYTYLPVNKTDGSYSDAEGFYLGKFLWLSILEQLKNKFEEKKILSVVKFPLIYRFMSVTEMRDTVLHFLPEYAKCIGRPCYLFIDGLDHAARSKDSINSFLSQLPRPEEVGDKVYFILVGQPINDKYPSWMMTNRAITYVQMPALETDDVVVLLNESGIADRTIDVEFLAKTVISVIGNNVLNIIFAILELKKRNLPLSFETIENELNNRCLNKQIDKYYEWLISSIEKNLLFYKIEVIFAFLSNKIMVNEISLLCGSEQDEVEFILNRLYPMVVCDKGKYFTFHNDVRLFLQQEILQNSNLKGIASTITKRIQEERRLWKYRYDISYNLILHCQSINEMMDLINVGYVMDAVLYGISFDKIIQQFVMAVKMPIMNLSDVCIKASAVSLCLVQFANCIRYYGKESEYFEKDSLNKKTISEKYCLSIETDLEQIIIDIYSLATVKFNRGKELFTEYLKGFELESLFLSSWKDEKLLMKAGYIFRCYDADSIRAKIENYDKYLEFVDGWLEASSNFTTAEAIATTLQIGKYNIEALHSYILHMVQEEKLAEDAYSFLLSILVRSSASVATIIELCTYGILSGYNSADGITYISTYIGYITKDENYAYDDERILGFIKAWFCVFGHVDESVIFNCYNELLNASHIKASSRGYEPAIAQFNIAKHVFELFFSSKKNSSISDDDILLMMYFTDKFGAGSCFDCNGFKVIGFIRKVIVKYAERNTKSVVITRICNLLVQCLSWDIVRYIREFNTLFCLLDAREDFLKVAEYWCGDNGVAWKSEYDEMDDYCNSIISALEYFSEDIFIERIREKQKYKLFGYVGRKDYSINGLLDCYRIIPLSEQKLCDCGLRMIAISDLANEIGDNRVSNEVNRIIFDDAMKLGYKYLNAVFELKNTPDNFVYWRMNALDSLYGNIDSISDDEELQALYNITNAWIKPYIEQDRQYGRLDSLKAYNQEVINRISSPDIRYQLKKRGPYGEKANRYETPIPQATDEALHILDYISIHGYCSKTEKLILTQIEKREPGTYRIISEAGKIISSESLEIYVNHCVIKFILTESKYGYVYTGIQKLFEQYYEMISDESWMLLFAGIVNRFATVDYNLIYSLWGDFSIFSIYYLMKHESVRIMDLFNHLCDAHEKLSSANGRVNLKRITLYINNDIKSLSDMVNFQLSI